MRYGQVIIPSVVVLVLVGLSQLPFSQAQPMGIGRHQYLPAVFKSGQTATPNASPTSAPTLLPSQSIPLETPSLTPTATQTPATIVISSSTAVSLSGVYHIVGEVVNMRSTPAFDIVVSAELYDSNGDLVGHAEGRVLLGQVPPGQPAPFVVDLRDPPAPISSYTLTLAPRTTPLAVYYPLTVLSQQVDTTNSVPVITGNVRNDQSVHLKMVYSIVTMYNDAGAVVDVAEDFVPAAFFPGFTRSYHVSLFNNIPFTRYTVQSEGINHYQ